MQLKCSKIYGYGITCTLYPKNISTLRTHTHTHTHENLFALIMMAANEHCDEITVREHTTVCKNYSLNRMENSTTTITKTTITY